MTDSQLAVLLADMNATGLFNSLVRDSTGAAVVESYYNQLFVPDYWVWKTSLTKEDITAKTSVDNTNWSWTAYISRSQGERDAFKEIFVSAGDNVATVNASLVNVRSGFSDIFSGVSGAAQRTHLLAIARRLANKFERLFSVGLGTSASPSTMVIEGNLSVSDVLRVWAL